MQYVAFFVRLTTSLISKRTKFQICADFYSVVNFMFKEKNPSIF
jgi:hypothetical protein